MYNDYFGFRVAPFTATPDPQFFFTNPTYQEAFATLQYGVLAKKGFVVVTGEVGTGKTTLLRKLLHTLGSGVHSVFIFNTQVTFMELLRLVLEDLGLTTNSQDKLTVIGALNEYLIERHQAGHIVALLIDEAQNLSDEVLEGLRLLSNLETDTEKLLQIVLMGQPELEKKLSDPKLRQLKQRVTLHARLVPLAHREVAGYIQFRLVAAGYEGAPLFASTAIDAIGNYSKGIPRLINIICDNALLLAFAEGTKEVSSEMIREVGADLRLEEKRPSAPDASRSDTAAAGQPKDLSWLREAHDVPDDAWVTNIEPTPDQPLSAVAPPSRKLRWASLGLSWALAAIGVAAVVAALDLRQTGEYRPQAPGARQVPVDTGSNVAARSRRQPTAELAPPQDDRRTDSLGMPDELTVTGRIAKPPPAGNSAGARKERAENSKPEPENQRKRIEAEIQTALQSRAITGVTVSVVDGTAYLDGRVASSRQKAMAERAARSVAEVKRVRNRLDVGAARAAASNWRDSWRDVKIGRE